MALVRAALAGDRAALEQLLGPHRRSVVAICYGILGNPEDAEDAAQETFLRALRGLSTFRRDAPFAPGSSGSPSTSGSPESGLAVRLFPPHRDAPCCSPPASLFCHYWRLTWEQRF